jgi:hypothetical protein
MISGIPTTYHGVRFRSRLEARWAVVFDSLHIRWQYEAIDLAGYVPDFLIGSEPSQVLVEIKPTTESLPMAQSKIECSGWEGEAVILSNPVDPNEAQPSVGSFGELCQGPDGKSIWWCEARAFRCLSCNLASFIPADGSWMCRECGADDGNAHVGSLPELSSAWITAGNRVQWRPE